MTAGLLLELDTRNCWTLAEALGHRGPHRLQHLLSRARLDHDRAREEVAGMVIDRLADQDVVLVVDETGDAKSSTLARRPSHADLLSMPQPLVIPSLTRPDELIIPLPRYQFAAVVARTPHTVSPAIRWWREVVSHRYSPLVTAFL